MTESRVPCPMCGAPVDESAKRCPVCGRGIAVVVLRATTLGWPTNSPSFSGAER